MEADELWLVAGGEPGADRFGQVVQQLRKGRHMSVEELAAQTDLSVGTIRAVEQGRRAPSMDSGFRLLRVLRPDGLLMDESTAGRDLGVDCSFVDPESGQRVSIEFKAKAAGDNRRWSRDKPRAEESLTEAIARSTLRAMSLRRAWDELEEARKLASVSTSSTARLSPQLDAGQDATLGRLMRRLATASETHLEFIEKLLDRWDGMEVGADMAIEHDVMPGSQEIVPGDQPYSPPHISDPYGASPGAAS